MTLGNAGGILREGLASATKSRPDATTAILPQLAATLIPP